MTVYPDGDRRDLIGRIRADRRQAPSDVELAWAAAMPQRHSHRRRFAPTAVTGQTVERLRRAAGSAVGLHRISQPRPDTEQAGPVSPNGR